MRSRWRWRRSARSSNLPLSVRKPVGDTVSCEMVIGLVIAAVAARFLHCDSTVRARARSGTAATTTKIRGSRVTATTRRPPLTTT